MLAEGIGEKLTPLAFPGEVVLLIAKPPEGASTGAVYKAYDALGDPYRPDIDAIIAAIEAGDVAGMTDAMGNALEQVTGALIPQVGQIEDIMVEHGAKKALMTGSGPTVFGIFDDEKLLSGAAAALRGSGLCETVARSAFYHDSDDASA